MDPQLASRAGTGVSWRELAPLLILAALALFVAVEAILGTPGSAPTFEIVPDPAGLMPF